MVTEGIGDIFLNIFYLGQFTDIPWSSIKEMTSLELSNYFEMCNYIYFPLYKLFVYFLASYIKHLNYSRNIKCH